MVKLVKVVFSWKDRSVGEHLCQNTAYWPDVNRLGVTLQVKQKHSMQKFLWQTLQRYLSKFWNCTQINLFFSDESCLFMLFGFSVQNEIIKNCISKQYFEGVARTEVMQDMLFQKDSLRLAKHITNCKFLRLPSFIANWHY